MGIELTGGMFWLEACSATVISHHPVPSGCIRLAWECSYDSGRGHMLSSPAKQPHKPLIPLKHEAEEGLYFWFDFFFFCCCRCTRFSSCVLTTWFYQHIIVVRTCITHTALFKLSRLRHSQLCLVIVDWSPWWWFSAIITREQWVEH